MRIVPVPVSVRTAVAAFLGAALLAGCTGVGVDSRKVETAATRTDARVEHVVDGDTLVLVGGDRVRLIGYDTPERDRCGYDEATALLRTAVEGRAVELVNPESVQDTDGFDRLLRYVVVGGDDVGEMMLASGLAVARYDSRDGYDPHPWEDRYREIDAATPHVCGID